MSYENMMPLMFGVTLRVRAVPTARYPIPPEAAHSSRSSRRR